MSTRILLADDYQMVRQGLKALLEQEGFSVVGEASDGYEAVRMIQQMAPDIAVLDLALSVMNGVSVARAIQHGGSPTRSSP